MKTSLPSVHAGAAVLLICTLGATAYDAIAAAAGPLIGGALIVNGAR